MLCSFFLSIWLFNCFSREEEEEEISNVWEFEINVCVRSFKVLVLVVGIVEQLFVIRARLFLVWLGRRNYRAILRLGLVLLDLKFLLDISGSELGYTIIIIFFLIFFSLPSRTHIMSVF